MKRFFILFLSGTAIFAACWQFTVLGFLLSSIAGIAASGSSLPYAAGKAALINMTRSLAKALAPAVRVNAVAPGFVDSPWTKAWPDDRKSETVEKTPLKRACVPDDIAEAMLFLCAGGAMVTGHTLVVDGGLTA